jgi:hypothetical protein
VTRRGASRESSLVTDRPNVGGREAGGAWRPTAAALPLLFPMRKFLPNIRFDAFGWFAALTAALGYARLQGKLLIQMVQDQGKIVFKCS